MFEKRQYAKKSFGQNFLVDESYIERIINALNPNQNETVIEIGPGRGALTERLLSRSAKVIAIELDRDLIPILRKQFSAANNFELIEADVLQFDFSTIERNGDKVKLIANLPYNISTPILQRLIEFRECFSELVLMFQMEVADRIAARPGSKERGFLTVLVEANFTVQKLFDVPGKAFRPVPKVTSSVVRLRPTDYVIENPELFRKIVSQGFSQRRKTILNNLKGNFNTIAKILTEIDISPDRRAETFALAEWALLVNAVAAEK